MDIKAALSLAALALMASATTPASERGKAFFYQRVVPRFVENGCNLCHATGYVRPQVLTYEDALMFLAIGDSPDTSAMIYKLANTRSIAADRPTHAGNQRCKSPDAEPCKTIKQWWRVEFGKVALSKQRYAP